MTLMYLYQKNRYVTGFLNIWSMEIKFRMGIAAMESLYKSTCTVCKLKYLP